MKLYIYQYHSVSLMKLFYIFSLFSRHRLSHGIHRVNLLSLLTQGTGSAEPDREAILAKRSWNALLFPHLASDHRSAPDISEGNEQDSSAEAATLSHLLGNLAGYYTRAAPTAN